MTFSKIDRGSAFPPGAPPSGPERDLLPSAGDDGRARATTYSLDEDRELGLRAAAAIACESLPLATPDPDPVLSEYAAVVLRRRCIEAAVVVCERTGE